MNYHKYINVVLWTITVILCIACGILMLSIVAELIWRMV